MTACKRPVSVLVVVCAGGNVLLLERREPAGYWQSVTSSLKRRETPLQAARREFREETGIGDEADLVDCGCNNRFPILPAWRHRYAPNVRWNTEHVFHARLPKAVPVRLNPAERVAYEWLAVKEAARRAASWTDREAILALAGPAGDIDKTD